MKPCENTTCENTTDNTEGFCDNCLDWMVVEWESQIEGY